MPTRRAVVRSLGAGAAGVVGLGTLATGAAVANHFENQPEHVTLTYDVDYLETYQPLLNMQYEDRQKLLGLYGLVATSPEYETDVLCYWCSYTHQEASLLGKLVGQADAHYGDHEPVQIEVDSSTGEVQSVRASVYHWLKGEVGAASAPLAEDGRRPRLRVINPWHQYTAAAPDADVTAFDVEDLTTALPRWLDDGLEKSLAPGTGGTNPWKMRRRSSWWRRGEFGISLDEMLINAVQPFYDETGSLRA